MQQSQPIGIFHNIIDPLKRIFEKYHKPYTPDMIYEVLNFKVNNYISS